MRACDERVRTAMQRKLCGLALEVEVQEPVADRAYVEPVETEDLREAAE